MNTEAEAKAPQVKQLDPNKTPVDNKELPPAVQKSIETAQQQQQQMPPMPEYFKLSFQNMQELVECINDLVKSKYAKRAIFDAMNELLEAIHKPPALKDDIKKTASDKE